MSCRAAVLSGADEWTGDSLPRFLESDPRGWWLGQRVLYSDRYLADVAREVGHDRFLRFWNSPDPVDTALATALKMPVGEWTERWQRRFVPRLPLGAAAPFSRSEEHTSELQSRLHLVWRLLLEKKKSTILFVRDVGRIIS